MAFGCCGCCMEKEFEPEKKEDVLYFRDKTRQIDFILVFREEDLEKENDDDREKRLKRKTFMKNLEDTGLEFELEPKEESQDQKTSFLKIHVPWPLLLTYAERMKVKMPLKVEKNEHDFEDQKGLCDCTCRETLKNKLKQPFLLHNKAIYDRFGDQDYFTAEFTKDKIRFFYIQDEKTFFTNPERSRIAHRIINQTKYSDSQKDIGIDRLVLDKVFIAAYPLHDGNVHPNAKETDNMRQLLYREWARWGKMFKLQPLDAIREYLSDKIALYFGFLQFYAISLFVPSVVGLVVFIYGLLTFDNFPASREVCDPSYPTYIGDAIMCPLCDGSCNYYRLSSSCTTKKITHLFDNESTIFFAVFMALWATMFLEFWKRRQFELSYDWDLVDYDEARDLVRPEYDALVEKERFNPITGEMETYMDPMDRLRRTGFSIVTVVFWVCLIIAAVFSIIVYRVVMHTVFAASVDTTSLGVVAEVASPSMLTTITGSVLSVLVIMILNKIYQRVAFGLTVWEIPRTRVNFENSFTLKIFFFQFVNFYSYLFYIAFFKNTFTGRPGDYNYLFGQFRWEGCDAGGCMYELTIQLLTVMVVKQLWNNIMELLLPWAMNKYRKSKSEKVAETQHNEYTRWEQDFDLAAVNMDLFYEYLEMVIQFGFVTLFVAALPLAPLLALLNNIVEIRLDAIKFITQFRRPLALKCSNIGVWYYLLELIGLLAVVTNAFTIAVTSETIPRLVYYYIYSKELFGRNTYEGYVNNSLSIFNVSDFHPRSVPNVTAADGVNVTECRYLDYREPYNPYDHNLQYWHVFAARLAFIIVIEHVVFILKIFLDYIIPDKPKKLDIRIKRERHLVEKMLLDAEKEDLVKKLDGNNPVTKQPSTNGNNSKDVVGYENEICTTTV